MSAARRSRMLRPDMWTTTSRSVRVAAMVLAAASPTPADGPRAVDTGRSKLTVHVYKSGLFSAFADNHVIEAPVASGSMVEGSSPRVEIRVRAADLRVLDPGLSTDRRAEVQSRMVGAEVLDVAKFPDISFASTSIDTAGEGRWKVAGQLTLHGQTRAVTFAVAQTGGVYRGEVTIKQRDFGIEPIRVAGGAVKVKDEVKIAFEIVPASLG